jgi:hypothetical protein
MRDDSEGGVPEAGRGFADGAAGSSGMGEGSVQAVSRSC